MPITVTEAAALLGVPPRKIRYWAQRGWLKKARKTKGGQHLLDRDETLSFEPPRVGWPKGTPRCDMCGGKLEQGHEC